MLCYFNILDCHRIIVDGVHGNERLIIGQGRCADCVIEIMCLFGSFELPWGVKILVFFKSRDHANDSVAGVCCLRVMNVQIVSISHKVDGFRWEVYMKNVIARLVVVHDSKFVRHLRIAKNICH